MRHWLGLFLCLWLGSTAVGQYAPGDILVAESGSPDRILAIRPNGAVATAAASIPFGGFQVALPSIDNRSTWFASVGGGLFSLSPSGVWSTVHPTLPGWATEVDGTGQLLLLGQQGGILGVDPWGVLTTLVNYPRSLAAMMQFDPTTGSVVLDNGVVMLRLATRPPATVTTLYSSPPPGTFSRQPVWSPETGAMVGWGSRDVVRMDLAPPHARTRLAFRTHFGRFVGRDPSSGLILAVHDWLPDTWLVEVNPRDGTVVRTLAKRLLQSDLCIARSRHLVGGGPAVRGQSWPMLASFPTLPGAPYVMIASFGLHTGVPVGNGRLAFLQPDGLTALSLSGGGIFRNFSGVLDRFGEARPAVQIPNAAALAGTRFFVEALVFGPAGVARVSDPIGVTIR